MSRRRLAALDAWLDLDYTTGTVGQRRPDPAGRRRDRVPPRDFPRPGAGGSPYCAWMRRAWPPPAGGKGTGANLFYRVDAAVLLALVVPGRGLPRLRLRARGGRDPGSPGARASRSDLSFHQHGPQFYSGSYGTRVHPLGVPDRRPRSGHRLCAPRADDRPPERVHPRWPRVDHRGRLHRPRGAGPQFQPARGRAAGAVPPGRSAPSSPGLETDRRDEFTSFASDPPTGNRMFWRSDFMVHRRPGWYASTKMASTRTGRHRERERRGSPASTTWPTPRTSSFATAREIHGIQAGMGLRRIPGTTCRQAEGALPLVNWGAGARVGERASSGAPATGPTGSSRWTSTAPGCGPASRASTSDDEVVVCLGPDREQGRTSQCSPRSRSASPGARSSAPPARAAGSITTGSATVSIDGDLTVSRRVSAGPGSRSTSAPATNRSSETSSASGSTTEPARPGRLTPTSWCRTRRPVAPRRST